MTWRIKPQLLFKKTLNIFYRLDNFRYYSRMRRDCWELLGNFALWPSYSMLVIFMGSVPAIVVLFLHLTTRFNISILNLSLIINDPSKLPLTTFLDTNYFFHILLFNSKDLSDKLLMVASFLLLSNKNLLLSSCFYLQSSHPRIKSLLSIQHLQVT